MCEMEESKLPQEEKTTVKEICHTFMLEVIKEIEIGLPATKQLMKRQAIFKPKYLLEKNVSFNDLPFQGFAKDLEAMKMNLENSCSLN